MNRPTANRDVIVNGDMSADITSQVTILNLLSMISYAYSWAGTSPVGTISVEVSNDYEEFPNGAVKNPGTWQALTFNLNGSAVQVAPVSGNTGNGFIDIDACAAYAIRSVYTFGSGVGALQCTVNGKVS